jgi:predicted PurR-regulated permease PerM
LEIVPYVGPIVSAIPGVILGFLISPLTGFLALLVYVVSQQLENNILVPLIMKRAVGLNPVAIILALLAGAKIGGALGAILAVPVAAAIGIVMRDMFFKENKNLQEK